MKFTHKYIMGKHLQASYTMISEHNYHLWIVCSVLINLKCLAFDLVLGEEYCRFNKIADKLLVIIVKVVWYLI